MLSLNSFYGKRRSGRFPFARCIQITDLAIKIDEINFFAMIFQVSHNNFIGSQCKVFISQFLNP